MCVCMHYRMHSHVDMDESVSDRSLIHLPVIPGDRRSVSCTCSPALQTQRTYTPNQTRSLGRAHHRLTHTHAWTHTVLPTHIVVHLLQYLYTHAHAHAHTHTHALTQGSLINKVHQMVCLANNSDASPTEREMDG